MNVYVLDLETTTEIEKANATSRAELIFEEEITFICATMYAPVSETKPQVVEFYGKDNAENAILNLPEGRYYTWNGARFDMHFIYHLLRKANYTKQNDEETRANESRKKQLKVGEFSYLLAGSKLISLVYRNHNGTIEIRDACLLFTCSLSNFIKNTAPEFPKLVDTYDYTKYRINSDDFTEKEKDYCRSDIYGFSVGLYRLSKDFEESFHMDILESFTAGSFSMKYAASKLKERHIKSVETNENFNNTGSPFPKKDELFPKVSFDRKFVIGGRTYVNPIHAGKILDNLTKIDANSFYPSIMVKSKLPYGKQKIMKFKGSDLDKFLLNNPNKYVFAQLLSGVCKFDDMFSPIVTSDDNNNRDYPTNAGSMDGVYLDDNILRDNRFKHHKAVFKCYIFDSAVGIMDYMSDVFDLKNKYKFEEKFALELAVKIILNATYGKFIQRPTVIEYDFFDGIIAPTGNKTNLRNWYQFAPMGAAITANCRYELCNYMNLLRERFVYCDTDSLVFMGEVPNDIPLGYDLGQWKVEASPDGIFNKKKNIMDNVTGKSIFFQRKTYAMEIDGETKITFCGISSNAVKAKFPKKLSDIPEFKFLDENEINNLTIDQIEKYNLYPKGISVDKLQQEMKMGLRFDVLQGNRTKNGIVLVERSRTKKYVERY
ncbi:MAG TPA: DNA polymerase [Candidatus Sulfopaludibacter sp.]|jgi:hypothetical protein|nr:DNA polymerase [Candidatus Sulfopaludibacter sp.]